MIKAFDHNDENEAIDVYLSHDAVTMLCVCDTYKTTITNSISATREMSWAWYNAKASKIFSHGITIHGWNHTRRTFSWGKSNNLIMSFTEFSSFIVVSKYFTISQLQCR